MFSGGDLRSDSTGVSAAHAKTLALRTYFGGENGAGECTMLKGHSQVGGDARALHAANPPSSLGDLNLISGGGAGQVDRRVRFTSISGRMLVVSTRDLDLCTLFKFDAFPKMRSCNLELGKLPLDDARRRHRGSWTGRGNGGIWDGMGWDVGSATAPAAVVSRLDDRSRASVDGSGSEYRAVPHVRTVWSRDAGQAASSWTTGN
ncbi:hypothetical protein DFH09DRAFT_1100239 [Mycena vulgaris]|nr:hypothetical protein DFH09DRAFT_1100239 [Mycena vulgaris]